jgi:hypothetical protein
MREWIKEKRQAPDQPEIESVPKEEAHRSLVLGLLFHQFQHGRKYRILDLGPAVAKNVSFFGQYSCKLYIEDFFDTLLSFDFLSPEDGFSYEAVFSYLFPYYRTTQFDFILTWDLLNYLDKEEFKHLLRHLGRFSHSGTLLFSLVSTQNHIPETPYRFEIADKQTLIYRSNSSVMRPSPKYEQRDLDRIMNRFKTCNSFHLTNGYREYLFSFE